MLENYFITNLANIMTKIKAKSNEIQILGLDGK